MDDSCRLTSSKASLSSWLSSHSLCPGSPGATLSSIEDCPFLATNFLKIWQQLNEKNPRYPHSLSEILDRFCDDFSRMLDVLVDSELNDVTMAEATEIKCVFRSGMLGIFKDEDNEAVMESLKYMQNHGELPMLFLKRYRLHPRSIWQ